MGIVKRMETAGSVQGQEQQITDIKTFAENVKHLLEQAYPSAKVDILEVTKNNGVVRTGVSILEDGRNVVPAIYLEEIFERYQNGMSLPQVCRVLEEIHQSVGRDGHFDTRYIRDFATIKGRICYKLINAEQNAAWLREIPHRLYQDLAIIYYILVERNNMGGACIMVRNDVMERWGVDESALYELARKNTPVLLKAKIAPMADVLKGFMDVKDFKDESSLYVATNEHRANGAIVMLYDEVLEKFAAWTNGDFYILPSSIHETLFLPAESCEKECEILEMVRQINRDCVPSEEILSDSLYRYDAKEGCVKMIR